MAKNLVIVESPAKANTIKRYLGPDFEVLASYGHVRDLLPKEGAVDTRNGFAMRYQLIEKNVRYVDAIAKAMRRADALFLATDLDREGEAISWHLTQVLKDRNVLNDKRVYRVIFHEITKRAIQAAMEDPRSISMDLVDAQQARRALDYLVGFNLSPLLWKKIKRGLSAGRVQSPALRMIAEREQEIEDFKPREYWTIEAYVSHDGAEFVAKLIKYRGEKIQRFTFTGERQAEDIRQDLVVKANGRLKVSEIEKKQRKRNPAAPFITSTLQQEAVRKLGFTTRRTMRVAQQLYEGVDIGGGSVGLITYMRTDSVNLAQEALDEIRAFVAQRYGGDQLPARVRRYRTKAKNAQEAHEAVRPTSVDWTPEDIRSHLSEAQYKLYELIWKRTVACQMKHATIDTVTVDLSCGDDSVFRVTGSTVAAPGFLALYEASDKEDMQGEPARSLPVMAVGESVAVKELRADQHFTEPPPRYTEASLVKSLEDYGIGRPSTYASIISTLLQREYVELDKKRFIPTDVGRIVNGFLTSHFANYVDYEFTARLEDKLDAISRGEKNWVPVMREFWESFETQVHDKEATVTRREASQARELGVDPKTGEPVVVRMGRFGPYVQIGSTDGEQKPRFIGLRPGQRIDAITLEEALELARLPRELGSDGEGLSLSVNIGRYGPYVRYGDKFISLAPEDDPYTITIERAKELIAEKRRADSKKEIKIFDQSHIKILNGPYGPYITDGKKNARVPKGRDPVTLSLEESEKLLAEASSTRRGRRRTHKADKD